MKNTATILAACTLVSLQLHAQTEAAIPTTKDTTIVKASENKEATQSSIRKLLVIGDSMTGWIGERLGAYGSENGYEVATVVWDGSTIGKWASSPALKRLVAEQKPDAIIVSLGLNELFERNPQTRLNAKVDKIVGAFGDVPYVWLGPPSWPGKTQLPNSLDTWLEHKLGKEHYFRSIELELPRQSRTNPHPSREGIAKWMDALMQWMPDNTVIDIPANKPTKAEIKRGKTFIYRKMNQTL